MEDFFNLSKWEIRGYILLNWQKGTVGYLPFKKNFFANFNPAYYLITYLLSITYNYL